MAKKQSTLDALYLDEDSPYALSGNAQELISAAKSLGVSRRAAQTYLQGEPSFTLHRPRREEFPRSKTVVGPSLDHTWQADLVEMQDRKLVAANKRTRYLLTVIDVLSKYAWVVGLKSKRGTAVRDALRYLLEHNQGRRPVNLHTDQGKEFYNKHLKRLLDEYDIHHYSTQGEPKASVVERFNRSLKELTYKYMTAHNTPKYLDALPELVDRYNQRIHSSIRMAPADVNDYNAEVVWQRLYKPTIPLNRYKFRPGDFVRTSKLLGKDKRRGAFGFKSAKGVWSRAVYTVVDRKRQVADGVNYYTLEDWQGRKVKGRFYEPQLQKVRGLPNRWRVAKKLKYKGRGPTRQVLVNWQGVAPDYQTWISRKDLKQYE
ncbi:uncharacterized protein LOC144629727 [Oculina patagonica]